MLMDIMMPEMDGYETMQVIRQNASFRRLPIIALDRESHEGRSREVPRSRSFRVSGETGQYRQLLSALRMWLHR